MKLKDLRGKVGGRAIIVDSDMNRIIDCMSFNNVFFLRPELADCEIEGFFPHIDHTMLNNYPDSVYNYGTVYTEIVIEREV